MKQTINRITTFLFFFLLSYHLPVEAQTTLYIDKGDITIGNGTVSGYDADGNAITVADANNKYVITQTASDAETSNKITITGDDIEVALQSVNINIKTDANPIWVQEGATLNLTVVGENKLVSTDGAGIRVTQNARLVIDAKDAKQLLDVTGGNTHSAIGEDKSEKGGSVEIKGGHIVAQTHGGGSAGIGQPGWGGSFQEVKITGGCVEAKGGGDEGSIAAGPSGRIEITGGVIKVNDDKLDGIVNIGSALVIGTGIRGKGEILVDMTISNEKPVNVTEGTVITIPADVTLTVAEGTVLVNRGTITGGGTLNNRGSILSSGTISITNRSGNEIQEFVPFSIEGDYTEESNKYVLKGGETTVRGSMEKYIEVVEDSRLVIEGLLSVNNSSPIDIKEGVRLTLVINGTNILKAGRLNAAIHVPSKTTLIIDRQSTGVLTVTGGENATGIGGKGNSGHHGNGNGAAGEKGGSIYIYGGTVIVDSNGEENAAGIGGGAGGEGYADRNYGGSGGGVEMVAIYGGTVISKSHPIGIGGGKGKKGGKGALVDGNGGNGGTIDNLIIAGGYVEVSGLGGGQGGERGGNYVSDGSGGSITNLTISGGTLTADWIGGGSSPDASRNGKCENFTITGGSIKLTDSNPLRNATPKGAKGEDLSLAITPELSAVNALSVGNTPYFISSHHPEDNRFYFYLPESPEPMYVRNNTGAVTTYTVSKKDAAEADGNCFDFTAGSSAQPNQTTQITNTDGLKATFGRSLSVDILVATGGESSNELSVPMDALQYQLVKGTTVLREEQRPLSDITNAIPIDLSGLDAGDYSLKVRYGGSHDKQPSAEKTLAVKVDKAAAPGIGDLTIEKPSDAVYNGQPHVVTATLKDASQWKGLRNEDISVTYYKKGDTEDSWTALTEGALPTDVGDYKFKVVIAESPNFQGTTLQSEETWQYSITKATPVVGDFTFERISWQIGTTLDEIEATIKEKLKPKHSGMGEIKTVTYVDCDGYELTDTPTKCGWYVFNIDVAEGTNYTAASDIKGGDSWVFVITPVQGEDGAFLIEDVEDLKWFRDAVNDGQRELNARLTADIDLEDEPWEAIGGYYYKGYSGIFDGDGHVISNVTLSYSDYDYYCGFFGSLYGEKAAIKNLGLVDVTMPSEAYYAGALVGMMVYGTIANCYTTRKASSAEVDPHSIVGGLVGEMYSRRDNCTITSCYTTFNSLVGYYFPYEENTSIQNCYYLQSGEGEEDRYKAGTPLPADQFASGDLARLLQQGQEDKVWGQRLGAGGDAYPILLAPLTEEEKNACSVYTIIYIDLPDMAPIYVNGGDYTPIPDAPAAKPGHTFVGWTSISGGSEAQTTIHISEDTQLYAVWSKDEPDPTPDPDPEPTPDPDPTPEPVYYTVTLPDTEGVHIDCGTGYHEVEEGDTFVFRLTLDEAYNQSAPVVTTSRGETLEPRAWDGAYEVKRIYSDIEIRISGIVKNPDLVANETLRRSEATARVIDGCLLLSVPEATGATLFDLGGRSLRTWQLPVGDTRVYDLPAGPYIVRFDGKAGVKVIIYGK